MSGRLFKANNKPNWCPGCGDYGLLSATTKALGNLGEKPHETVIVSGNWLFKFIPALDYSLWYTYGSWKSTSCSHGG